MYSKSLALLLMSLSIMIMGSIMFICSLSISCESLECTLFRVLPGSLIIGVLGFIMGTILDSSTCIKKKN